MTSLETTSWRLIRGAARGEPADRDEFARRYLPAVRAYFAARWRRSALATDVEDAVQEVFVECFRPGGALPKADSARSGGFRAFFVGVLRNVALRHEQRSARNPRNSRVDPIPPDALAHAGPTQSQVVDRRWAFELMRLAVARQTAAAAAKGDGAMRRVELLRLRFQDNLAIREIAGRWNADPAFLHHEYAQARKEFEAALYEVLAERCPSAAVDSALQRVLAALA